MFIDSLSARPLSFPTAPRAPDPVIRCPGARPGARRLAWTLELSDMCIAPGALWSCSNDSPGIRPWCHGSPRLNQATSLQHRFMDMATKPCARRPWCSAFSALVWLVMTKLTVCICSFFSTIHPRDGRSACGQEIATVCGLFADDPVSNAAPMGRRTVKYAYKLARSISLQWLNLRGKSPNTNG